MTNPTVEYTDRDRLSSSVVREAFYNNNTEVLTLDLQGTVYRYSNVPEQVFEDLTTAPSAGNFYGSEIKGKYGPGYRVGDSNSINAVPVDDENDDFEEDWYDDFDYDEDDYEDTVEEPDEDDAVSPKPMDVTNNVVQLKPRYDSEAVLSVEKRDGVPDVKVTKTPHLSLVPVAAEPSHDEVSIKFTINGEGTVKTYKSKTASTVDEIIKELEELSDQLELTLVLKEATVTFA